MTWDLYQLGLDALAHHRASVETVIGVAVRHAMRVRPGDHKTSIKNASDVAAASVAAGKKIVQAAQRLRGRARVRGGLSPAAMKKVGAGMIARGQKLLRQARKHKTIVQARSAKQKAGAASARKFLARAKARALAVKAVPPKAKPTKPLTKASARAAHPVTRATAASHVFGADLHDILSACWEILGDDVPVTSPAPSPDATAPGLLSDGSIDPNQITGAIAADPNVQALMQQLAHYPPQPIAPPPRDPSMYTPDPYGPKFDSKGNPTQKSHPWDDATSYTIDQAKQIKGAIEFDDTPSLKSTGEEASLGSASRFMAEVAMNNSAVSPPSHEHTSGFQLSASDYWQRYQENPPAFGQKYSSVNSGELRDLNAAGAPHGYGPIIGRPKTPFEGLRYATDGAGNSYVFWYWDTAPDRIRLADDLTRLQQAITDWAANKTMLQNRLAEAVVNAQLKQQQAADAAADQQKQAEAQAVADAQAQQQREQELQAAQAQADLQSQARQAQYDQQRQAQEAQMEQAAAAARSADEQHAQEDEAALQQYAKMQAQEDAAAYADEDAELEAALQADATQDELDQVPDRDAVMDSAEVEAGL